MKWLTDRSDLGLFDGLIIFLCVIYFTKKAYIDKILLTRTDLAILTLAFLYVVTILIHSIRTSRQVSEDNLEALD